MKKIFKILAAIVLAFILIIIGGMFYLTRGLNNEIALNGVNVSELQDGIYRGIYKGGRWTNELQVTIKNYKIEDIVILEDVSFVRQGISEELFKRVKAAQNTTVDAVSEATITSKAYLKSIENAINN